MVNAADGTTLTSISAVVTVKAGSGSGVEGEGRVKVRGYLLRSLWAGAFLLVAVAVASAIWGLLAALGDSAGARVAKGITLGLAVCWAVDLIVVIVLSALAQLGSPDRATGDTAETGAPSAPLHSGRGES